MVKFSTLRYFFDLQNFKHHRIQQRCFDCPDKTLIVISLPFCQTDSLRLALSHFNFHLWLNKNTLNQSQVYSAVQPKLIFQLLLGFTACCYYKIYSLYTYYICMSCFFTSIFLLNIQVLWILLKTHTPRPILPFLWVPIPPHAFRLHNMQLGSFHSSIYATQILTGPHFIFYDSYK